jgi:hypothetical protein
MHLSLVFWGAQILLQHGQTGLPKKRSTVGTAVAIGTMALANIFQINVGGQLDFASQCHENRSTFFGIWQWDVQEFVQTTTVQINT